ncbi:hypothetical protein GCM10010358_77140 [Streptomyces minutiscleroticus]|uniref:Uncharacterized protein n=1 Tax=Streptomyces minutiscleroticus TaxID=68238 RepID=A0A918P208_9ACTN|nr:hypothetical protein GCM10010358_77140 [Streptomyces minutiscleroticus]
MATRSLMLGKVAVAVVNQDRSLTCQHIVRVQIRDGQVVDRGQLLGVLDLCDVDAVAVGGAQPLACGQVARVNPLGGVRDPERVPRGRADTAAVVPVSVLVSCLWDL